MPVVKKKFTCGLLGLAILLLIANIWLFLDRRWESNFVPASYAELYYPKESPVIRSWRPIDKRVLELEMAWTKTPEAWVVHSDSLEPVHIDGKQPVIRIDAGADRQFRTYTLTPLPEGIGPDIHCHIRFVPAEHYRASGQDRGDVYTVRANVPCGEFPQHSLDEWADDYDHVGKKGLRQADSLIRHQAGVREDDPTLKKIEKLTKLLRAELRDARGVPSDAARWKNPWQLFVDMRAGREHGWCTQHAQIFVFFANRAGIPTRFVFGARTQDNTVSYTGHSWAECFVSEQNRWALVDMDFAFIAVLNKQQQVLNTAEIFHLNQHGAWEGITARVYIDHRWQDKLGLPVSDTSLVLPFARVNGVIKRQFIEQAIFTYRRAPHVEDVRDDYTGFLKSGTFLRGNLGQLLLGGVGLLGVGDGRE